MLSAIVRWVIHHRWLVLIATALLTIWTFRTVPQMPLDVFPPFAPPQVEIETEAPGLAPEEVESLVTLPLESSLNGMPGVTDVRSASATGISVVKAVFEWGTDIFQARQLVTERLQQVQGKLPEGVEIPRIAPPSSPIGTILKFALTVEPPAGSGTAPNQTPATSMMALRNLVDWKISNQLLAVPGVSQVTAYGGEVKQFQVLVDPAKLAAFDLSLDQVTAAAAAANANAPGGYLLTPDREILIRGIGRIESIQDLQNSVVVSRQGTPVRLADVATVQIGAGVKRGDGSLNGQPAVIIMVNKQPQADTPTVTRAVEAAMAEIQTSLPPDVRVNVTFRQENYIAASVDNVQSALLQGSLIVAAILIPFLMNWRTLTVCLLDFFLTLLFALLVCHWLGLGLNTMTLGGLAVAIGTAVDDAIVYGENTYRRLRENRFAAEPEPVLDIIFEGSQEVRESLLGAMLIGIVVFSPIFTLAGVEGRIFTPMGIAYLVVVIISSLESLLVSPALCAILLPHGRLTAAEPWVARFCKRCYDPLLRFSLRRSSVILSLAGAILIAALVIVPTLGRSFLPEFQEQTLVNTMTLYPGTSLAATNRAGYALEMALQDDPRFTYVQTRSGRAPGDGDAGGVNFAHVDVTLSEAGLHDRAATVEKLRQEFAKLPGVASGIGGFISHRMDEVLSGVRSQIAIKIFGPDLDQLRQLGQQVETQIQTVAGLVDLQLEPQMPIDQIQIAFDRTAAARYGLTVGSLAEVIETALNGRVVSQVLENQQTFDLVVWLQPDARKNFSTIENLLIDKPNGEKVPLSQVAQVHNGTGPNTINRENVSRRIVVSANVSGRDLRSVVNEIQQKVKQGIQLPAGYFIQYGGQFEAEERATQNILIYSLIAAVIITVLMYLSVKSIASTAMIMINLPIALVGGIISVLLTGGVLSVASLVGFVTLFGVATRNGLLLVDNYNSKFAQGIPLRETLVKGSMERLNAILMTALTSALGLFPLVISGGPGREILQPLSIVVLGGLFTSTALTLLIIPALYARFGSHLIHPGLRSVTVPAQGEGLRPVEPAEV
ncbi:MAG: efflux RND transporter permease subunit [Elainella sp.]